MDTASSDEDPPKDLHPGGRMRDSDNKAGEEMIDHCLGLLSEHFDTMQFIGTVVIADGRTSRLFKGRGNWYARKASAEEFIQDCMLTPSDQEDED